MKTTETNLLDWQKQYLNEFCYRFNRREWEAELPLRLLNACLTHTQAKLKIV